MSGQTNYDNTANTPKASQEPDKSYMEKRIRSETKQALEYGAAHIEQLHRANELLAIQADAFRVIERITQMSQNKFGAGYASTTDAAYNMRRLLEEINRYEEQERVQNSKPENSESGGDSTSGEGGRPSSPAGEGAEYPPSAGEGVRLDPSNSARERAKRQQLGQTAPGAVND